MVTSVLSMHLESVYTVLPSLPSGQIQTLYKKCLLRYSYEHIAPLCVQGNQLRFYTEQGPGYSERLTDEQIAIVAEAFKAVQKEAGINSMSEKKLGYLHSEVGNLRSYLRMQIAKNCYCWKSRYHHLVVVKSVTDAAKIPSDKTLSGSLPVA